MAKKKNQDGQETADDSPEAAEFVEQPKAEPQPAEQPKVDEIPISVPSTKWRVTLSASTPLAFPSLEINADTGEQAKEEFDKANGINGSDHPYTIEQV